MKRIVVCPSCKIKMQIFDIGKEINQKCPRCKNSFDIHPVQDKDKSKTADKDVKEQPEEQADKAPQTEPPKSKTAQVSEAETPGSEPPDAKAEPKSADKPAEKEIMVKPPVQSSANVEAISTAEKPEAETAIDTKKSAVEAKNAEATKAAAESTKTAGSFKKSTLTPKPALPATPATEPQPSPTVIAGFSGMQFMILFVMLLAMIIIQLVFAKRQMSQLSIVNDNLKVIHGKL
ncbi:MAG: hypothetical protein PHO37_15205 [Kiritimatiellae bacterium]|nr:hypothetical protein [Kiritimatiellia bacterium]